MRVCVCVYVTSDKILSLSPYSFINLSLSSNHSLCLLLSLPFLGSRHGDDDRVLSLYLHHTGKYRKRLCYTLTLSSGLTQSSVSPRRFVSWQKKKEMMPLFNLHFLSYSFYINYLVPYFFPFNVFSRAKENNGIVLCDIKLAVFFCFLFFLFCFLSVFLFPLLPFKDLHLPPTCLSDVCSPCLTPFHLYACVQIFLLLFFFLLRV